MSRQNNVLNWSNLDSGQFVKGIQFSKRNKYDLKFPGIRSVIL